MRQCGSLACRRRRPSAIVRVRLREVGEDVRAEGGARAYTEEGEEDKEGQRGSSQTSAGTRE